MKKTQKVILAILVILGSVAALLACFDSFPSELANKWPSLFTRSKALTASGLLFDIAGIVQLEISGLFETILDRYGDEKKYPYGPPSHVTRMIIDDPDSPLTPIKNKLFYDRATGFQLISLGFVFQFLGVWL